MGYQKGKIILFFATVTFLSCCNPAASSVLPRVTRTDDAIIVDFADSPIQSKNYNGETIIQLPGFNPYAIMQQKPQKVFYEGWPFFFGYPTPTSPSTRQFEEVQLRQQVGVAPAPTTTKAPTPAPTPATCGRGPAKFPGTRSLISGRVTTGADVTKAKNNAWPFMRLIPIPTPTPTNMPARMPSFQFPDITKPSATLMQGKVGIVANSECRVEPDFGKYVSDSTICVASTTAFSCAGDVGGPVVILSAPGTWTLVGINSYTKAHCLVLPSTAAIGSGQLGQPEEEDDVVQYRTVSIVDELQELGRHSQTVCPFKVENKTVENDHPLGNVVITIDEIVCSGT